jgi:glycosyltransferase involved in cell wall biosynthesis
VLAPHAKALFFSSDNLTRNWHYPYRPSWFYARVERFAFRECAAGSAVSQDVERVLRSKGYRRHVEIVPHGLDLEDYSRDRPGSSEVRGASTGPVIGYVGRLLEQKGVDTLLRAFSSISSESRCYSSSGGRSSPSLVIVGDGPDAPRLQALTRDLGLGERVRFLPAVPHDKVAPVYRSIDILVVPSRTTPLWVEQFGRVLIEGMAAGCVVIGSSSGAIPSVIADAGLIFTEDDVPELSAELRRVLGDPGLSLALRAKALTRVRALYTWDAVAGSVSRLYERVLGGVLPRVRRE